MKKTKSDKGRNVVDKNISEVSEGSLYDRLFGKVRRTSLPKIKIPDMSKDESLAVDRMLGGGVKIKPKTKSGKKKIQYIATETIASTEDGINWKIIKKSYTELVPDKGGYKCSACNGVGRIRIKPKVV